MKSFTSYTILNNLDFELPISLYTLSDYIAYLATERNVAKSTASTYISHLKNHHINIGLPIDQFLDNRLKTILRGLENYNKVNGKTPFERRVVSYEVLKIWGNTLSNMGLSELEFTSLWTLCLFLWWGSFRGSELLPPSPSQLVYGLKWRNIMTLNERLVIHIPSPKVAENNTKGATVDLLPFQDTRYCPVTYLHYYLKLKSSLGPVDYDDLVFTSSSHKPYTTADLNKLLSRYLDPIFPSHHFTQYSFRPGLVCEISSNAGEFTYAEQLSMGRWRSDSVEVYKRQTGQERSGAITRIMSLLFQKVHIFFHMILVMEYLIFPHTLHTSPPPSC